jgi:Pentapeptide repeats (8 copies)
VTIKRSKNFWEPIFAPEEDAPFTHFNWNLLPNQSIVHMELNAESLYATIHDDNIKITLVNFKNCDFRGSFTNDGKRIKFHKCNFSYCDFGLSQWDNAKFSNCSFVKCSFTLFKIRNSQLMDCTFSDIGFSGNETSIHNTLITNPEAFVSAGYTNTDPHTLSQNRTTPEYQIKRLEETKAKISRLLMQNLELQGDDEVYYKAVKTYILQILAHKYHSELYEYKSRKYLHKYYHLAKMYIIIIEKVIISLSGLVNNWGSSVGRPVFVGMILTFIFALTYFQLGFAHNFSRSLLTSFDTTFLVGYSKYPYKNNPPWAEYIYALNVFLGIWWYAIFIPTIINRICRVRG